MFGSVMDKLGAMVKAGLRILPACLSAMILFSCGVDSDKFRLEGRLRNIHQGEFWVYSMDGSTDGIDTIPVREGRFSYEIPLRSPSTLIVIFPNYSEQPVFAEPGAEVEIKGDASHLREIAINGTDANEEMTKLRMEISQLMPPQVIKHLETYIKDHPDSPVSIYLLQRYFLLENEADYKKVLTLVNLLSQHQPDNGQLISWKKRLKGFGSVAKNDMVPTFSARDIKGRSVSLDDLKKQVNVLSFWASWNYQSTDMQRRLLRLKLNYGDKLGVVSICLDADPASCKEIVQRDTLAWKTVCDGRMWDSPLLAKFGVADIPSNMIINSKGTVLARNLTPQNLEDEVEKILKKEQK